MQPIHQLLDRIKWDPGFRAGRFALGYEDRIVGEEKVVPFRETAVEIDASGRRQLSFHDEKGVAHRIPLHRIRTVYQDGTVIWQRPSRPVRRTTR